MVVCVCVQSHCCVCIHACYHAFWKLFCKMCAIEVCFSPHLTHCHTVCFSICVCGKEQPESGLHAFRGRWDNASLTGAAVNSHSPGRKCFICPVNYTVRHGPRFKTTQPLSCREKQWNNDWNQLFQQPFVLRPTTKYIPITPGPRAISPWCQRLQSEMERLLKHTQ